MYLNSNIPFFEAKIKAEFLYNQESHKGEYIACYVFGITAIKNRALGFSVMTDGGAQFIRLPLHALVHKESAELSLEMLQLWDCLSYNIAVTQYNFLRNMTCDVLLKDKKKYGGRYMFTIDYCASNPDEYNTTFSEDPEHNKCQHIIKLDNGNFCAYPNNRIFWKDASFITNPITQNPGYQSNKVEWFAEDGHKWITGNNNDFFYEHNIKNDSKKE